MSDTNLATLDLWGQAELLALDQVSSGELIEAAIARLERINPQLNAVIHPNLERARQAATDPALAGTRLRGVPIVMKDIGGGEAGLPNHAGMRALKVAGYTESVSSYLTERLRAAGAISLGRTNTPELALLPTTEPDAYGATRNPWKLTHSPGGSSGGTAAAVASGIVAAGHASDGGGSIRGPASACGLVGLKPTRARTSFAPGLGERWSGLSAEFMLCRSVRDCALLLDLLGGPAPGDPYVAPPPTRPFVESLKRDPPRLRVALMKDGPRGLPIDPACSAAAVRAARQLEQLGHHVEETHPEALDDPAHVMTYVSIVATNTARALDKYGEALGRTLGAEDVEHLTWALAAQANLLTAPRWLATIEALHRFGRELRAFWDTGFDLLLTPTMGALPAELGLLTSTAEEPFRALLRAAPYGCFTLPFNMSGQPALSIPGQPSPDGLPVGVQLVGQYGCDELLIAVAAQMERAAPWSGLRPPLLY